MLSQNEIEKILASFRKGAVIKLPMSEIMAHQYYIYVSNETSWTERLLRLRLEIGQLISARRSELRVPTAELTLMTDFRGISVNIRGGYCRKIDILLDSDAPCVVAIHEHMPPEIAAIIIVYGGSWWPMRSLIST